jgi:uncharacterized membrane protein YhhN
MALLILSFACALLHWYSRPTNQQKIEYFAKPATMVFLILWFTIQSLPGGSWLSLFITLGLIFCLAGDIFLMLPSKWFLAGLIAFLLGHIAYICGLNLDRFDFHWQYLLIAAAILAAAIPIFLHLRKALIAKMNERLVLPVMIYVIVISIMVFSASTTLLKPEWSSQAGLMITIGATLFFISDALLAWNRFVKPLPQGRLISIVPYHLAQYFIAFGVLYQIGVL